MAARKALITQAELTRYLKAAKDAGIPVARCEVTPDGKVIIYSTADPAGDVVNEWDSVFHGLQQKQI